jgi:hypothetical protein
VARSTSATVGGGPSFQSLRRTKGGTRPTVVASTQMPRDDASSVRKVRNVNESQTAEIHQGTEEDAMKKTFREGFDED